MSKFATTTGLIALAIALSPVSAGAPPSAASPIETRPQLTEFGSVLPNGLRYVIVNSDEEPGAVRVDLNVDVGNFDVRPGEEEFPHLIEHILAAHYSTKGGGRALTRRDTFAAFGGGLLNLRALTAYRQTVYSVQVPSANLARALDYYRGIAGGSKFTEAEFRSETNVRGVEGAQIQAQSASFNIAQRALNAKVGYGPNPDEKYVLANHRATKFETIRKFYEKWYVPSRQTVRIYGDIGVSEARQLVEKVFSDIPGKPDPKRSIRDPKFDFAEANVAASPAATMFLQWGTSLPAVSSDREAATRALLTNILMDRFRKSGDQLNGDTYGLGLGELSEFVEKPNSGFDIRFQTTPDRVEPAMRAIGGVLFREISLEEFEAAKRQLYAPKEGQKSAKSIVKELARGLENGKPGQRVALPKVTSTSVAVVNLASVRQMFNRIFDVRNARLAVNRPSAGKGDRLRHEWRRWLKAGSGSAGRGPADVARKTPILASILPPVRQAGGTGREISSSDVEDVSNGVGIVTGAAKGFDLILIPEKSSTSVQVDVLSNGQMRNDLALASKIPDLSRIMRQSGDDGLSREEHSEMLRKYDLAADVDVDNDIRRLNIYSMKGDVGAALRLVKKSLAAPPYSEHIYQEQLFRRKIGGPYGFDRGNIIIDFINNGVPSPCPGSDMVPTRADAQTIWRALFGRSSNPTIVIRGPFQPADLIEAINAYIVPEFEEGLAREDVTNEPIRLECKAPGEIYAISNIAFVATGNAADPDYRALRAANDILSERINHRLREIEQGVYIAETRVGVAPRTARPYLITQFGAFPENVARLNAAVWDEIQKLRTDGPTADELKQVSNIMSDQSNLFITHLNAQLLIHGVKPSVGIKDGDPSQRIKAILSGFSQEARAEILWSPQE